MKTESEIKEALRAWVLKKSKRPEAAQVTDQTSLLESRIISSLQVMELILEIERLKGSNLDIKQLKAGAFQNIDTIYTSFFKG